MRLVRSTVLVGGCRSVLALGHEAAFEICTRVWLAKDLGGSDCDAEAI